MKKKIIGITMIIISIVVLSFGMSRAMVLSDYPGEWSERTSGVYSNYIVDNQSFKKYLFNETNAKQWEKVIELVNEGEDLENINDYLEKTMNNNTYLYELTFVNDKNALKTL